MKTAKLAIILLVSICIFSCKKEVAKVEKETLKRPNIIFLMDDQHRFDALGILNKQVITPTLDNLAKNGVLYSQAVCQAPMCVPSRNSMMLGLYPNQTGVYRNSDGLKDEELPVKTMAEYFKEAGYETAGFGKTHWGKHKTNTRGFETRYTSEIKEEGGFTMLEMNPEAKKKYDDEIADMGPGEENNLGYLGFTSKLEEEQHRDGWITKQVLNYINKREDERPLFLYLSYMKPHAGHNVPKGYEDLYDADIIKYAEQPNWTADNSPHSEGVNRRDMYREYWSKASKEDWQLMTMRYYANVTWIDDMMGRTLAALKEKGLLENTLIVYTSDHGEMLGERYYKFNKYNLYDASVRIPMILSGTALPKKIQRNSVDNLSAENTDLLPTLLDFADIKQDNRLLGESLLSTNRNKATFAALHERKGEAAFMWRTANYKLILVFNKKENAINYTEKDIITGEFYNLEEDPKEWTNLYNSKNILSLQKTYQKELINFLNQQEMLVE
ncbi:sulfatase-like hydrolase/transferase [uncultured Polaribacter sp.]|uniref:sulfatase family protein n=1 Tax=uncultured Polaribacter sp. TaxID=174711 RepID=UPI00262C1E41|nr:sulfatase-like hydrolase/transferase [uncultured Polaribacter sp.]